MRKNIRSYTGYIDNYTCYIFKYNYTCYIFKYNLYNFSPGVIQNL